MFTEAAQGWMENAPHDTSYPLQIFGDTTSALVHYVDTPGLFGAEIRSFLVINFRNGKVTRQVDYWDGRGNPIKKAMPSQMTSTRTIQAWLPWGRMQQSK